MASELSSVKDREPGISRRPRIEASTERATLILPVQDGKQHEAVLVDCALLSSATDLQIPSGHTFEASSIVRDSEERFCSWTGEVLSAIRDVTVYGLLQCEAILRQCLASLIPTGGAGGASSVKYALIGYKSQAYNALLGALRDKLPSRHSRPRYEGFLIVSRALPDPAQDNALPVANGNAASATCAAENGLKSCLSEEGVEAAHRGDRGNAPPAHANSRSSSPTKARRGCDRSKTCSRRGCTYLHPGDKGFVPHLCRHTQWCMHSRTKSCNFYHPDELDGLGLEANIHERCRIAFEHHPNRDQKLERVVNKRMQTVAETEWSEYTHRKFLNSTCEWAWTEEVHGSPRRRGHDNSRERSLDSNSDKMRSGMDCHSRNRSREPERRDSRDGERDRHNDTRDGRAPALPRPPVAGDIYPRSESTGRHHGLGRSRRERSRSRSRDRGPPSSKSPARHGWPGDEYDRREGPRRDERDVGYGGRGARDQESEYDAPQLHPGIEAFGPLTQREQTIYSYGFAQGVAVAQQQQHVSFPMALTAQQSPYAAWAPPTYSPGANAPYVVPDPKTYATAARPYTATSNSDSTDVDDFLATFK